MAPAHQRRGPVADGGMTVDGTLGPMDILLLTWNFPPVRGGIETFLDRWSVGLRGRGHPVRVVTAGGADPAPRPWVVRPSRPGMTAYIAASFLLGARLARERRPEVVAAGNIASAPAALAIARRQRCPWVLFVYGAELVRPGWLVPLVVRLFLRCADLVVTISEASRRLAVQAGAPPERLVVIPPGADLPPPPPDRADPYPGRRVLLTVGRLIRRKGVLEFVEHVMPRLVRRQDNVLLVVVGDDARASLIHRGEPMRARIADAVLRLGLDHHVQLLGAVGDEDLGRLYGRADLFVLPCIEIPGDVEGFGIVLIEAALAGVPALATRVGGIPDAVHDGHTGVLVAPGDWTAMADAAIRLLTDEPLRRRMGEAARARAEADFVWPAVIRRHEEVLRALAARVRR